MNPDSGIIIKETFVLRSLHNQRFFASDLTFNRTLTNCPIILFIHGFKGFKNWGPFDQIATTFARQGYAYLSINLSHNGTTCEHPSDFVDLEAFGKNNLSIELDDIGILINHIYTDNFSSFKDYIDIKKLFLIGHSRGGGLAILKAKEDTRVKGIITWAAVSDIAKRWAPEVIDNWKKEGVQYIYNSRTQQKFPMYYQFYENYLENKHRLDIPNAAKQLKCSVMFIHGDGDESLPLDMALELKSLCPAAELKIIPGGSHTFGGRHPHLEADLPLQLKKVLGLTKLFLDVNC